MLTRRGNWMFCVILPFENDRRADGAGQCFSTFEAPLPCVCPFSFTIILFILLLPLHSITLVHFSSHPLCAEDSFFLLLWLTQSLLLVARSAVASNMSLKVGHRWVICCTFQMIIHNCHHIYRDYRATPSTMASAALRKSHCHFLPLLHCSLKF